MAAEQLTTGFNTQPPEGGCGFFDRVLPVSNVSTHSRLKAAADFF